MLFSAPSGLKLLHSTRCLCVSSSASITIIPCFCEWRKRQKSRSGHNHVLLYLVNWSFDQDERRYEHVWVEWGEHVRKSDLAAGYPSNSLQSRSKTLRLWESHVLLSHFFLKIISSVDYTPNKPSWATSNPPFWDSHQRHQSLRPVTYPTNSASRYSA